MSIVLYLPTVEQIVQDFGGNGKTFFYAQAYVRTRKRGTEIELFNDLPFVKQGFVGQFLSLLVKT